jgi:hypothetical protein
MLKRIRCFQYKNFNFVSRGIKLLRPSSESAQRSERPVQVTIHLFYFSEYCELDVQLCLDSCPERV